MYDNQTELSREQTLDVADALEAWAKYKSWPDHRTQTPFQVHRRVAAMARIPYNPTLKGLREIIAHLRTTVAA